MEQPSNIVDDHIDDFIHTGRFRWDLGCFIFDEDPIYDIEGTSHIKDIEIISSKYFFLHPDGPSMYQPNDMVIGLFHQFEDELTLHFQDDFQPSYSDLDKHQVMALPKNFEAHTTKHKYFHVETFCVDLQIKNDIS
jgi:hypothetical protein